MDAQTLFRKGVSAIRDEKDLTRGRQYLIESLKYEPNNDMAWLWLTHTVTDPQQRLTYIERALRINPDNPHAQQLKAHLKPEVPRRDPIQPLTPKTMDTPLTPVEKERVDFLMAKADGRAAMNDIEGALEQWLAVLKIRVDYELAIRSAIGHLWRLNYREDAHELIQRALDAHTHVASIYLTAIDIAEREQNYTEVETLRETIATLAGNDERLVATVADHYIERHQLEQALQFLEKALQHNPEGQQILIKLGDINKEIGRVKEATAYYDQAVRLGTRTRAGKEADKRLSSTVPVLTDRERGSVWLAVRESLGISLFFVLMAWQDARLDLFALGPRRIAGILMSLLGSYLLVTATSSPQQTPIAGWLGGTVPTQEPKPAGPGRAMQDPTELPLLPPITRYLLAFGGVVLLVLALALVMFRAFDLTNSNLLP